jgi:hypothetical protein
MRNVGRVLFAVALLSMVGCFKVHVIVPNTVPTDAHGRWVNGWLWGSIGGHVDASHFCGGRPIARITTKRSLGNLFVSWITFGIYTPSHVTVVCGQGAGFGPSPMMPQPMTAPPLAAPPTYAPPAYPAAPYQPPPPPRY